jgi:hypothetical protein
MGDTLTTILILIGVSVVAAALRARRKDRCMTWFDGHDVTLHGLEAEPVSGHLEVESNAYIVTYDDASRPQANEIFYASEWESMAWLERVSVNLDVKQAKARVKRMRKAVRPGLFVRMSRDIRILLNSAKDTVLEILSALMAATRKATPIKRMGDDAAMLDKIKKEGGETLTAYAHEPVWERYRGQKVILEALNGSGLGFEGILVEYSQSYILLFDAGQEGRDILVRRDLSTVRHILR